MPRPILRPSLSWILILLLFAPAAGSCGEEAAKAEEPKKEAGLADPAGLEGLKYRAIGPAWGGRVSRAAGVPGDPLTYYAATASGGVWKSTDGGFTWKPDLRRPADLLDRLDRRVAVGPQRGLRRIGRGEHPRQRRGGQRHLQVHRRGQDLDPRLEAGGADRDDGRPPDATRTSRSRRCSATPSAPTRSAASTAPGTAAGPGSRCSRRTRTPAPRTWPSIPRTRTSCSPGSGRRGAVPGR